MISKLVALILDFATDKKHLDTAMYIPAKRRLLYLPNSSYLYYKVSNVIQMLEYKPNSALMFAVSSNSLHREELTTEQHRGVD